MGFSFPKEDTDLRKSAHSS